MAAGRNAMRMESAKWRASLLLGKPTSADQKRCQ